ncbi:hypothetical protein [Actinoallomurus sp. CA-150999]|uniref:hypothetical protein n=1 Tax=Actinoallomurus sp. CA-150999 TaxID=3239887 RepID=UPI003D92F674
MSAEVRRGLLASTKVDGTAGYALSQEGYQILREGDRRIFERRQATTARAGSWPSSACRRRNATSDTNCAHD